MTGERSIELSAFKGSVFRIMYAHQKSRVCEPVSSPFGRFHYDAQFALYTSCTEEGAKVAMQRYLHEDDPDRIIVSLEINADRVYDIRKTNDAGSASVVWQDIVARGERSPTWEYSDAAREAGAQGMLYSSRSRPELAHLVLFDFSTDFVKHAGVYRAWKNDR